jgi:mannobiose 2-epimerase
MNRRAALYGLASAAALAGVATAQPVLAPPQASAYRRLAAEMDDNLRRQVVDKWLPRSEDKARGGFQQNFAEDWSLIARDDRAVVYQARVTWLAAQAAKRYPAERAKFQALSNHGLAFLSGHLWDAEKGGFFWGLNPTAPYAPERFGEKHIYGHAFAIYALAENYAATGNSESLELAKRGFLWLDTYAHDGVNGGYYESLDRQNQPILAPPTGPQARPADAISTPFGRKSMNTHIHILEALTGLYEVWPDPRLRIRLQEVFEIVRDKVAAEPGYLNLYFQPDWTPVPSVVSFGHDVETGFLLVEASTALGQPDDARTWAVARKLVDRPLAKGWDEAHGGFYDEAEYAGRVTKDHKVWWVQAEGLNALLVMHEEFGRETPRYWQAFQRQWAFIRDRQTDAKYGGWYSQTEADGHAPPGMVKSDRWTEGYHQGRALIRVSDRLRRMATEETNR